MFLVLGLLLKHSPILYEMSEANSYNIAWEYGTVVLCLCGILCDLWSDFIVS